MCNRMEGCYPSIHFRRLTMVETKHERCRMRASFNNRRIISAYLISSLLFPSPPSSVISTTPPLHSGWKKGSLFLSPASILFVTPPSVSRPPLIPPSSLGPLQRMDSAVWPWSVSLIHFPLFVSQLTSVHPCENHG